MAQEISDASASTNRSVSRSAFKVTLGGFFSLLAGLASQVITAAFFGAGAEMDAYLTAMVVPLYLQAVLLSGLSFVFIPAFVNEEAKGNDENAWALAGTFFWLTSGLLTIFAIVGFLYANTVISLTAPGFSPEKAAMATKMLAVMMFTVPLAGISSLTAGIENIRNSFFWPAAATAIGSLGNVIVLLGLHGSIGAMALAWGYLISALLQAAVTTIPMLRHGWKKLMPLNDSRVAEMAKLIAPFIIFGLLTRSTSVFERYFASNLPTGQLSYIGYAYKISNIFVVLLASSIASAIFPTMARAFSETGDKGLIEKTEYGIRLTLAVALPAVAIISTVAIPLIGVLFERGAFVHEVTLMVSKIVFIVMLNDVLCRMAGNMISRSFYVLKDTITFTVISTVTAFLYIFLAKVLVDASGYVGLALAQPIQAGLAVIVSTIFLVNRLKHFHLKQMFKYILIYTLTSITTYFVASLAINASSSLPQIFQLATGLITGGIIYLAILYWWDREITISILEMMGIFRILNRAKGELTRLYRPDMQ
jgi:putative peptidoglycan lipid II flippase